MKVLKTVVLAFVGIILAAFIAFIPMKTQAATITNGQTVKLLNQGKQFYKFTLEDDALVQIKWINNANDKAQCIIYDSKTRNITLVSNFVKGKSGRQFLALKKGTYYLDLFDDSTAPSTKITINWTPASKYDTNNYTAKKAQLVSQDTVVRIPQVHNHDYMRWYKIKVTRAHIVTLTKLYDYNGYGYYLNNISIYSSNLDKVGYTYDYNANTITTTKKLAVGTYYISVGMIDPYAPVGEALAFKWN